MKIKVMASALLGGLSSAGAWRCREPSAAPFWLFQRFGALGGLWFGRVYLAKPHQSHNRTWAGERRRGDALKGYYQ